METVASLPSVSIKVNLNLRSSFPFTYCKNGLSFVIQKDLQLPNCFIKIEVAKGNVKDIKLVDTYVTNPIVRKDMNNFVVQSITKEQTSANFVLCFEFAYKKWNYFVSDLQVVVPFHTLSHLEFGDYYYEEFVFYQPDNKNGNKKMVFKAYWVRSIDFKKAPVFKLYVEKKNGIIIKGADKDNMVLTIPDKPSSRITYATKKITFFFDFEVYPQLSPSYDSSNDCNRCLSAYGMDYSPWYLSPYYNYYPTSLTGIPTGYPNMMNWSEMFKNPYTYHTCTSSQNATNESQKNESETVSKEFSLSALSNVLSETTQTILTEKNQLNHTFDENKPPEFTECEFQKLLPKSAFIDNSLLSISGQTAEGRIFIDRNRQLLNSLPKYSKFSAPIGGHKVTVDASIQERKKESSCEKEKSDMLSLASSKSSTVDIPTSKPENQLDLTNPTLAKLFDFHDGKLTQISPPATPKNILKKLFPSNISLNSSSKKSTSDNSFEITDPSVNDIECEFSDFSESFKSTSSKPQSFKKAREVIFTTSDGKEISGDAELLSKISPRIKSMVDKHKTSIIFRTSFRSNVVKKMILFSEDITFHKTFELEIEMEVYKFAKHFEIQSFMDCCVAYLKTIISDQTVEQIFKFAKEEGLESLKYHCHVFIREYNLELH